MKAVVYKDAFNVAVEEVPEPRIQDPQDAIVKVHAVRRRLPRVAAHRGARRVREVRQADRRLHQGRTAPGRLITCRLIRVPLRT